MVICLLAEQIDGVFMHPNDSGQKEIMEVDA